MEGIEVVDGTRQLLNCINAIHDGKENISEELENSFISVRELLEKDN